MNINYKGTKVNYIIEGSGEINIVYLHGWGGSVSSFLPLAKHMSFATNILIDFPPFGESDEPSVPFELNDYVNIVNVILEQQNVKKFSIVSHSFGTRVAVMMCCKNINVDKLVITSGAGIKPKNKLKKFFRKIRYKVIKFFTTT